MWCLIKVKTVLTRETIWTAWCRACFACWIACETHVSGSFNCGAHRATIFACWICHIKFLSALATSANWRKARTSLAVWWTVDTLFLNFNSCLSGASIETLVHIEYCLRANCETTVTYLSGLCACGARCLASLTQRSSLVLVFDSSQTAIYASVSLEICSFEALCARLASISTLCAAAIALKALVWRWIVVAGTASEALTVQEKREDRISFAGQTFAWRPLLTS